jgi:hypothetical protein
MKFNKVLARIYKFFEGRATARLIAIARARKLPTSGFSSEMSSRDMDIEKIGGGGCPGD